MEQLFVYGTLKDQDVQLEIIGRKLKTIRDSLMGFEESEIVVEGSPYRILVEKAGFRVEGKILEVSKGELDKIDIYETKAYKRVRVETEKGFKVWVYVK